MKLLILEIMALAMILPVWAAPITARYVRVEIPKDAAILTLGELQVFSNGINVALKGTAVQTTTGWGGLASKGIDGKIFGDDVITHTADHQPHPMWDLDLGAEYPIDKIVVWNRPAHAYRLYGMNLILADEDRKIRFFVPCERPNDRDTSFVIDATVPPNYRVGERLLTFEEVAKEVKIRAMMKQVNLKTLIDAFNTYSDKYPESYTNKAEILADLNDAKVRFADFISTGKGGKALFEVYRKLQKKIILQHPAVDFDEILFVKRRTGTPQGLFINYMGNSGYKGAVNNHLIGYDNVLMRAPLSQDDGEPTVLKHSTAFLGDLCLNWDADKILLSSGKETPQTAWRLYEIDIDGKNFKDIYPSDDLLLDIYDGCYLPDGRIMTTSSAGFHGVPCDNGDDFVANMYLIDQERKNMRRLTFDQDMNWNPEVYPNGRVIFLRWEYADTAHYFSRILMTMNPDGTDQKEFYGSNSYWPNSIYYHQNIPGSSTKFVGVVSGHHGVKRKGELVMFDVSKGRHETSGAIHKFPFRGKKVENITKDHLVDNSKPFFLHPRPLNDELVLVAIQDDGTKNFRIAIVDVYDNILTLWDAPDAHFYEPIPIKKTKRPPQQPDRVDLTSLKSNIYMTNVYIGQDTLKDIPQGEVKKLLVYHFEYSPRNIGGHYSIGVEGPWDPRIIHGTVDVEDDGSVLFEVDANTPIATVPLDKDGRAIQMMRSWMVAMPGETLSCIGCHENQNLAAPTITTIAARKPPQQIKPWFGAKRGFAFDREVQPVLDAKCVGCHNGDISKKNAMGQPLPNLTFRPGQNGFSGSYLDLHPYVRRNGPEGDYHILTPMEFHTTTSDLIQILEKGHHGVVLTDEELNRFDTWIDLNVPYFGTWTERGASKLMIAKRREYDRLTTNFNDFDPEAIINPYIPGSIKFQSPKVKPNYGTTPKLAKWPFDGATKQGVKQYIDLSIGHAPVLKAVKIPTGSFVMGSNSETAAEAPQSIVIIEKPFYMATTEVTIAQWREFDPTYKDPVYDMHWKDQVSRGYFMRDPQFPAIRISWDMAQAYCAWLSEKTGKKIRLPTEDEWEYACRAGTNTPMNYGDFNADFSKDANLADITFKEFAVYGIDPKPMRNPSPFYDFEKKDARFNDGVFHLARVGSFRPNAFGLYDMHGNVSEWTSSAWAPYPYNKNAQGDRKVLRGGSWYQRQIRATSAWRYGYKPWHKVYNAGIRLVIEE